MEQVVDDYATAEAEDDAQRSSRMNRRRGNGAPAVSKSKRDNNERIELDRLARLGIFVEGGGGQGNGLVRIQTQALGQLREMKAYLRRMADRSPTDSIDW